MLVHRRGLACPGNTLQGVHTCLAGQGLGTGRCRSAEGRPPGARAGPAPWRVLWPGPGPPACLSVCCPNGRGPCARAEGRWLFLAASEPCSCGTAAPGCDGEHLSSPCPRSLLHSAGGFGHFPAGVSPAVIPERLRPHVAHLPKPHYCPLFRLPRGTGCGPSGSTYSCPSRASCWPPTAVQAGFPGRQQRPLSCTPPQMVRGPRRQPQLAAGHRGWEQDCTNVPPGFVCPARWGLRWWNAGPRRCVPRESLRPLSPYLEKRSAAVIKVPERRSFRIIWVGVFLRHSQGRRLEEASPRTEDAIGRRELEKAGKGPPLERVGAAWRCGPLISSSCSQDHERTRFCPLCVWLWRPQDTDERTEWTPGGRYLLFTLTDVLPSLLASPGP